jgi:hypothetical protein
MSADLLNRLAAAGTPMSLIMEVAETLADAKAAERFSTGAALRIVNASEFPWIPRKRWKTRKSWKRWKSLPPNRPP